MFRYKGRETDVKKSLKNSSRGDSDRALRFNAGEQLILNLELVDGVSENICGLSNNRQQNRPCDIADEIVRDVTNKLRIKLSARTSKVAKSYTANNEAYKLYLKGRYETRQVHARRAA